MLAEIGHGVEIEIERLTAQDGFPGQVVVPQKHVRVPRRTEAPPRLSALHSPSLASRNEEGEKQSETLSRGATSA
jgi:hypothetical protein